MPGEREQLASHDYSHILCVAVLWLKTGESLLLRSRMKESTRLERSYRCKSLGKHCRGQHTASIAERRNRKQVYE
eukprot:4755070-Pleurochrysis_carterae.AAC.2